MRKMNISDLKEIFSAWIDDVIADFSKSFSHDYRIEILEFLHKNIDKEIENAYSNHASRKRIQALYTALTYLYNHFCLKISHQKEYYNVKRSCVRLLSQLIKTGLILSKGVQTSQWLDRILTAIKMFTGDGALIYDALLLVNHLKKKHHKVYVVILKHILNNEEQEYIADPLVFMEVILLYRRLKCLLRNRYSKASVISMAAKIKPPANLISWLLAFDIEGVGDLKHKTVVKQLMKNKFPSKLFQKIRELALNSYVFETRSNEKEFMVTVKEQSDEFVIDEFSVDNYHSVPHHSQVIPPERESHNNLQVAVSASKKKSREKSLMLKKKKKKTLLKQQQIHASVKTVKSTKQVLDISVSYIDDHGDLITEYVSEDDSGEYVVGEANVSESSTDAFLPPVININTKKLKPSSKTSEEFSDNQSNSSLSPDVGPVAKKFKNKDTSHANQSHLSPTGKIPSPAVSPSAKKSKLLSKNSEKSRVSQSDSLINTSISPIIGSSTKKPKLSKISRTSNINQSVFGEVYLSPNVILNRKKSKLSFKDNEKSANQSYSLLDSPVPHVICPSSKESKLSKISEKSNVNQSVFDEGYIPLDVTSSPKKSKLCKDTENSPNQIESSIDALVSKAIRPETKTFKLFSKSEKSDIDQSIFAKDYLPLDVTLSLRKSKLSFTDDVTSARQSDSFFNASSMHQAIHTNKKKSKLVSKSSTKATGESNSSVDIPVLQSEKPNVKRPKLSAEGSKKSKLDLQKFDDKGHGKLENEPNYIECIDLVDSDSLVNESTALQKSDEKNNVIEDILGSISSASEVTHVKTVKEDISSTKNYVSFNNSLDEMDRNLCSNVESNFQENVEYVLKVDNTAKGKKHKTRDSHSLGNTSSPKKKMSKIIHDEDPCSQFGNLKSSEDTLYNKASSKDNACETMTLPVSSPQILEKIVNVNSVSEDTSEFSKAPDSNTDNNSVHNAAECAVAEKNISSDSVSPNFHVHYRNSSISTENTEIFFKNVNTCHSFSPEMCDTPFKQMSSLELNINYGNKDRICSSVLDSDASESNCETVFPVSNTSNSKFAPNPSLTESCGLNSEAIKLTSSKFTTPIKNPQEQGLHFKNKDADVLNISPQAAKLTSPKFTTPIKNPQEQGLHFENKDAEVLNISPQTAKLTSPKFTTLNKCPEEEELHFEKKDVEFLNLSPQTTASVHQTVDNSFHLESTSNLEKSCISSNDEISIQENSLNETPLFYEKLSDNASKCSPDSFDSNNLQISLDILGNVKSSNLSQSHNILTVSTDLNNSSPVKVAKNVKSNEALISENIIAHRGGRFETSPSSVQQSINQLDICTLSTDNCNGIKKCDSSDSKKKLENSSQDDTDLNVNNLSPSAATVIDPSSEGTSAMKSCNSSSTSNLMAETSIPNVMKIPADHVKFTSASSAVCKESGFSTNRNVSVDFDDSGENNKCENSNESTGVVILADKGSFTKEMPEANFVSETKENSALETEIQHTEECRKDSLLCNKDLNESESECFPYSCENKNYLTFSNISLDDHKEIVTNSRLKDSSAIINFAFAASAEVFSLYRNDSVSVENEMDQIQETDDKILPNSQTSSDDGKSQNHSSDISDSESDTKHSTSDEMEIRHVTGKSQLIIDSKAAEDCLNSDFPIVVIKETCDKNCVKEISNTDIKNNQTNIPQENIDVDGIVISTVSGEECIEIHKSPINKIISNGEGKSPRKSLRLQNKLEDKIEANSAENISQKEWGFAEMEIINKSSNSNNISEGNNSVCNNPAIASASIKTEITSAHNTMNKSPCKAKSVTKNKPEEINSKLGTPPRYSLRKSKRKKEDHSADLGIELSQLHINTPSAKIITRSSNKCEIQLEKMQLGETSSSTECTLNQDLSLSSKRETRSSIISRALKDDVTDTPSYNLRNRKSIIAPGRLKIK